MGSNYIQGIRCIHDKILDEVQDYYYVLFWESTKPKEVMVDKSNCFHKEPLISIKEPPSRNKQILTKKDSCREHYYDVSPVDNETMGCTTNQFLLV